MFQKKNVVLLAIMLVPFIGFSQFSISGKVVNKKTQEVLYGSLINLLDSPINTISKKDGSYEIKNLDPGKYILQTSFPNLKVRFDTIELTENKIFNIELSESARMIMDTNHVTHDPSYSIKTVAISEIVVSATRNNPKSAMVQTYLDKKQIAEQNLGQDLPYLLNQQTSVVTTSDAGTGVGYTGIRIRGSDATRVNVTINGIPVNDAESQGAYWVDLPDIASSIDNIQVQRGVGTSTNGAGAFGGSLNIQTTKLNPKAYGEYNASYGSFNTFKNTVNVGSGLIDEKFAVDARLSKITSDGFIDRGKSDLQSYYLSGGYFSKSTIVKFITFSGQEETYQAWNGIPEARLKGDVQGIEDYISRNYLDAEDADHLRNSNNRTYNQFTYENQVDHYKQDYYQLHYSHEFNSQWNSHVALFYTKGKGYYEEYKKGEAFSKYGLDEVVIGSTTITSTNLVRRRWLNNDFYGTTFSLNYDSHKKLSALIGGGWNRYDGQHFGEVIWAQYASNAVPHQRYYNDTANKTDINVFLKVNYLLFEKLNIFADIQERNIYYEFLGYNRFLENVHQAASLNFINPKIGVNYDITGKANVYASYSIGQKEPSRDDYTQSTPDSRPKPEKLQDIEVGYKHFTSKANWGLNLYYMDYKDQLIVTGKVNDVGAYVHTNVPTSLRQGIEAEFGIQPIKQFSWNVNATLSKNKIRNFREFVDNYDTYEQELREYKTSDIAFSPSIIGGSTITVEAFKNFKISFISKYVGEQFLDNTSAADKKLDAFFVNDVRINYTIKTKFIKEIGFILSVNNVFNEQYESNGYTYGYIAGGQRTTENFYYPQAGINFMGGISLKF
jgi:iron complex outermembrane receptor protein